VLSNGNNAYCPFCICAYFYIVCFWVKTILSSCCPMGKKVVKALIFLLSFLHPMYCELLYYWIVLWNQTLLTLTDPGRPMGSAVSSSTSLRSSNFNNLHILLLFSVSIIYSLNLFANNALFSSPFSKSTNIISSKKHIYDSSSNNTKYSSKSNPNPNASLLRAISTSSCSHPPVQNSDRVVVVVG